MTKRKDLKKRLNNENLLTTMSGGAANIVQTSAGAATSSDKLYTGGPVLSVISSGAQNGTSAVSSIGDIKGVLGANSTTVDPTGITTGGAAQNDFVVLQNYTSGAMQTVYTPPASAMGLLPWIADQIKKGGGGVTYSGTTPLGSNIPSINKANRVLTLEDFVGILSGAGASAVLSLPADLQAAIDTGPIAQYKHLPAV